MVFPDDSVRYSVPLWLLEMWKAVYPRDTVEAMLSSFLEERRLFVRCNLGRASREEIRESLESQGVDYLERLEAFQKGWIQVQDFSSSLVALAAAPREGDYCIDVCGAPGGKSLHVADLMKGTGTVEVRDVSARKTALIEENIKRSGFANMKAVVMDALVFDEASFEKADVLIADLPCSGLGIIGRKPDIKYRMTLKGIEELAGLQREILSVVWQYVKPGGTLVYSTCTISRKENEENAAWFAENYPFRPVNIEGRFGNHIQSETMKGGTLQLLPGIDPGDGFFLAVFERI